MSRTATARKLAPLPQVDPEAFDRWRGARTDSAATVVGYTPMEQLYEDFCIWSEAALGLDQAPDIASFRAAFDNAPKPLIRFETLQCRAYFRKPKMAECASLTLRAPIQVAG